MILLFALFLLVGCSSLPNNKSTSEEICSAIKWEEVREGCLAYVKEDPSICRDSGCYVLAFKLKDPSICTNNGDDKRIVSTSGSYGQNVNYSNDKCLLFAGMDDVKRKEFYNEVTEEIIHPKVSNILPASREPVDEYSIEEILSKSPQELCFLEKKNCYGTCEVARWDCIKSIAILKNDYKICKLLPKNPISNCYKDFGIAKKDISVCNKANEIGRDVCYMNVVTDYSMNMYGIFKVE